MPRSETVEEFARLLVSYVRDMAIENCDGALNASATHVVAQRWRERIRAGEPIDLAKVVIPDCVDATLFYLLNAIDQGLLTLSFTSESGHTIDLAKEGEGEMSGWYMATNGWRKAYSKERFVDDFEDLKLDS